MTDLKQVGGSPRPRRRREGGPGSNPRDHLSRLDWRFLIPGIEGARVLLLGPPTAGELKALCSQASRVVAAVTDPLLVGPLKQAAGEDPHPNLSILQIVADHPLPFRESSFDLVAFPGGLGMWALLWPSTFLRDVGRVLAPDGTVCVETRVPIGSALVRRWASKAVRPAAVSEVQAYWTVWRKGSMRAALPLEDASALAGYFFQNALYGRSRTGRILTSVARWLARGRLLDRVLWTRATVILPKRAHWAAFSYVRTLARRQGVDLGSHRIALLTNGSYDSNKNAFFVFDPATQRPVLLLKVTRSPTFNYRLVQEYEALCALHEQRVAAPGSYPEAVFLDQHEGLAVLAEKVVQGLPFRTATTAEVDCPVAAGAVDWIVELGSRSAETGAGNRKALAERFEGMLDRLDAAYELAAGEKEFLETQLSSFRSTRLKIPLVFRHGDAGTWNVQVLPNGDPAFLDWELAEQSGPPLWDLFDFTRSYVTWMGRVAGATDPVAIYRQVLEERGAAFDWQLAAIRRYLDATGLPNRDVEPLLYFYWIDRALRQAAWAPGPLAEATYIRLLRACIELRGQPGLRRVFEGEDVRRRRPAGALTMTGSRAGAEARSAGGD